ncbi:carboxylesterase/lipase family protein [Spirillospora sp. CA-255316]
MSVAATTAGKVRGLEIDDGIVGWRGIPYAAAPVGPLRFRTPEPPPAWAGVRDATSYGARAVQADAEALALPNPGIEIPPASEDCLHLNVTAPAGAERRPVLVWIHGGGYRVGSGTDMAGDGSAFARDHGLVVVTFNYRLGAFGFLDLEDEPSTGAYGLHDQIAALRWVHDNIASFGGDPGRVTVYGLSAGGKSVANLLASPLTRGLVGRAACSSGGGEHVSTPERAVRLTRRFLRELGTAAGATAAGRTMADRLRQVPAAEILAAQEAIGSGTRAVWIWRPTVDGTALTRRPVDAIAAGAAAGIPLLAQTCANEGGLYRLMAPDAAEQADRVLAENVGPEARDRILAAYARSRPELADDPAALRVAVMSDERYGIPTTRLADAQSAHAPVWRSRYDGPFTGLPDPLPAGLESVAGDMHAAHGADGIGVWNGGGALSDRMHAAWGAFASGADPGWPAYTVPRRDTMIFDPAGPHTVADPRRDERAAWDGLTWGSGTWWRFDGVP